MVNYWSESFININFLVVIGDKMALYLDRKPTPEQIRQFATQMEHLDPNLTAQLDELFDGGHSKEFYEGLITAYANMYQMAHDLSHEKLKEFSGSIVAYVAFKLTKMGDL